MLIQIRKARVHTKQRSNGKNVSMGNSALADPGFECNVRRAVVISLKEMSPAVFHDNRKQRPRQGRRIAKVGEMSRHQVKPVFGTDAESLRRALPGPVAFYWTKLGR